MAQEFRQLQYALENKNESGIIIYPNGEAVICNWAGINGIPHLFEAGIIGDGQPIIIAGRGSAASWRKMLEAGAGRVIYDRWNDYAVANDCRCEWITVKDGSNSVTIIAPEDWA